ncbi:unnamed protein product [Arctogadus glacialis]
MDGLHRKVRVDHRLWKTGGGGEEGFHGDQQLTILDMQPIILWPLWRISEVMSAQPLHRPSKPPDEFHRARGAGLGDSKHEVLEGMEVVEVLEVLEVVEVVEV